jgi:uncharacterized membrane protein
VPWSEASGLCCRSHAGARWAMGGECGRFRPGGWHGAVSEGDPARNSAPGSGRAPQARHAPAGIWGICQTPHRPPAVGKRAGVADGLISAFAWGVSAVAATPAVRRAGAYIALLLSQAFGVAALSVLAVSLGSPLGALRGDAALGLAGATWWLVLAGGLSAAGWYTYYLALKRGPVGLVCAVAATYGGVTALLAVFAWHEHLSQMTATGVVLAVAGVATATARTARGRRRRRRARGRHERTPAVTAFPRARPGPAQRAYRRRRGGVPLAIVSALTYGASAGLLGNCSSRAGWLPSTIAEYAASVLALGLFGMPFLLRPTVMRAAAAAAASISRWAAAAGLTEAAALIALARGGQIGQMGITAAMSSLYPVIPLAAGQLWHHRPLNRNPAALLARLVPFQDEQLGRMQQVGVGVIIASLIIIGLA